MKLLSKTVAAASYQLKGLSINNYSPILQCFELQKLKTTIKVSEFAQKFVHR